MALLSVTDATFDTDINKSDLPVLVEFGTEWCAPCKQLEPTLIALSQELSGQVTVAKINVDDAPETAMKLGVRGIPSLFIFKDGQVEANRTGTASEQELRRWLEAAL